MVSGGVGDDWSGGVDGVSIVRILKRREVVSLPLSTAVLQSVVLTRWCLAVLLSCYILTNTTNTLTKHIIHLEIKR